GAGRRGRGARILERAARGVPGDPRAALLVPQDIECSCRAAEVGAPGGEEGARRDLERRGQVPRPRRGQGVRVDLWCEVSEGGRPRSATTSSSCWRSTTSRPSTGFI